jgi:hypothetical protein
LVVVDWVVLLVCCNVKQRLVKLNRLPDHRNFLRVSRQYLLSRAHLLHL